jgi:tripartite-type tricarboxylate transporter receptor subunit TctC
LNYFNTLQCFLRLASLLKRIAQQAIFIFLALYVSVGYTQTFPSKPIKVIVTYPAGGSSDLITRLVAQKLGEVWNQPVVIENRPGAAGSIGMEYASHLPADGHSLVIGNLGPAGVNPLMSKVNYNMDRDFMPVTIVAAGPNILVVNSKSDIKSLKELLKLANSKPNAINYGTSGPGSLSQLAAELLKRQAKVEMQEIPYKGGMLAVNDVLAGQIQMIISDAQPVSQFIAAGNLRPLAITSNQRSPLFPNIPTFAEGGIEGMEASNWWVAFIPAGTSKPIADAYSKALTSILAMPDIKEKFAKLGVEAVPTSPDETKKFLESEKQKYAKLIKDNNIKAE